MRADRRRSGRRGRRSPIDPNQPIEDRPLILGHEDRTCRNQVEVCVASAPRSAVDIRIHRPEGLVDDVHWVPVLDPHNVAAAESDLFPGRKTANGNGVAPASLAHRTALPYRRLGRSFGPHGAPARGLGRDRRGDRRLVPPQPTGGVTAGTMPSNRPRCQ